MLDTTLDILCAPSHSNMRMNPCDYTDCDKKCLQKCRVPVGGLLGRVSSWRLWPLWTDSWLNSVAGKVETFKHQAHLEAGPRGCVLQLSSTQPFCNTSLVHKSKHGDHRLQALEIEPKWNCILQSWLIASDPRKPVPLSNCYICLTLKQTYQLLVLYLESHIQPVINLTFDPGSV